MKKRFLVLLIFLLCHSILPMKGYAISASSAIIMEKDTGRVLYQKDAFTQKRIASITKIMTAIIAIESGKMDEIVTVSEKAAYTEGSSIYLKPGDKVKVKDLVYGLMLRSGNDAAVAIAEHIGGSLEGFCFLMNQKAEELGMYDSFFSNPHGLDDHEKHYSTAYDMALLSSYAQKNSIYDEITSTKAYRTELKNKNIVWRNKNRMLEKYNFSTGGKTGFTKRARRTLVSTAKKDDMELIAVTLNAPDDWNDHIAMFSQSFTRYKPYKLVKEGKIEVINDPVFKGNVVAKRDVYYPLTEEERKQITIKIKLIKPQKEKWEKEGIPSPIGRLTILLDEEEIESIPLYFK